RHPHGARRRCAVLAGAARRDGARGRGRAAGAVGSRLGGRGDERRVAAAAVGAPLPGAAPGAARAPVLAGVRGEGIPGGYSAVYSELRALETLGPCRRGYFVEGLGGAQFALGGAVERLGELRPREGGEPGALR